MAPNVDVWLCADYRISRNSAFDDDANNILQQFSPLKIMVCDHINHKIPTDS